MGYVRCLSLGLKGIPDIYRGSENRRFGDKSLIDQIITFNFNLKNLKHNQEIFKWKINILSKFCSQEKKKLNPKILDLVFNLKTRFFIFVKKQENFRSFRIYSISNLGNLIHNTCSFTKNELNLRIETFYEYNRRKLPQILFNHVDVLKKIKAVDYKRGSIICGSRGYFFKNTGILLNFSIIRYGLDFLSKRKYINLQTPYFMNGNLIKKCTQLNDFSEQLYEIKNSNGKFLIATSEQPISTFHWSEKIPNLKLPLKYSGFSTCFRKEGGSHGKDTSGIFRVHQFEKIEQFIIGKSDEKSWKLFEEMLGNAKSFYNSLNIPFKSVNIPSGAINLTASKKIDIMGFFPSSKTFRELVSCSNCTTHQSKKLSIEYNLESDVKTTVPVTMLNSTLCATTRLICCICENYQNSRGVIIPEILRSYIGISFLPFYK